MNWEEISSYNYPLNILDYKKQPKKSKEDLKDTLWYLMAAVVIGAMIFVAFWFNVQKYY